MEYQVTIFKNKDASSKIVANANVAINGQLVVKGFKVVSGAKGLFISNPSVKAGSEYHDQVFPITNDARTTLYDAILEAYNAA